MGKNKKEREKRTTYANEQTKSSNSDNSQDIVRNPKNSK